MADLGDAPLSVHFTIPVDPHDNVLYRVVPEAEWQALNARADTLKADVVGLLRTKAVLMDDLAEAQSQPLVAQQAAITKTLAAQAEVNTRVSESLEHLSVLVHQLVSRKRFGRS